MSQPNPPQGVTQTAFGVTAYRALERQHADRLFDDPLADRFVAAAGPDIGHLAEMPVFVAVRTKFFDDCLLEAARHCPQIVLLGAGLDARAFRLDWPDGTTLYEIDLSAVLEFKKKVLTQAEAQPRCSRVPVAEDLRGDWPTALLDKGFQPAQPTAWLAEGLLVYLSESDTEQLFDRIGKLSAPGSRIALGHQEKATVAAAKANQYTLAGTLYKSGLGEAPEQWLARHGWRGQARRAADCAAEYGRTLTADIADIWLMSAVREG
jgi:methyltransferase (TIGR00027 family)